METRDRSAHVIIGKKGQGKSPYIKYLIDNCYDLRSDKILILTASTPKAFENYVRVASINKLKQKWHGVVLYYGTSDKQMLVDVKELVMSGHMNPGAIFFDDCTPYLNHTPGEEIKSFLTHHKNMGTDIYWITHGLGMFSSFCRKMVSSVTLFKTNDTYPNPRDFYSLKYPNSEALYQAWLKVNAMPVTKNYIQPHITVSTGV